MGDWKIYTKTGDKGQTSLIGGTRVPKHHIRIEAYGTVDELNSFIGLIRDSDIPMHYKNIILEIQDRLFTAESLLALDSNSDANIELPQIRDEDIEFLEKEIDSMNESLPVLNSFILPGGHVVVSYCHVARCVCRRAERIIIRLSEENKVDDVLIRYFNRLSDYLFVLARKMSQVFNVPETPWIARKDG